MLALLAIRARIAGAPAPAHGPLYEGAVYTGALLGVRARVERGERGGGRAQSARRQELDKARLGTTGAGDARSVDARRCV